jgi:hypothetical protein
MPVITAGSQRNMLRCEYTSRTGYYIVFSSKSSDQRELACGQHARAVAPVSDVQNVALEVGC